MLDQSPGGLSEHLRAPARPIAFLVGIGILQAGSLIGSVIALQRLIDRLYLAAVPSSAMPFALLFCGFGLLLASTRALEYIVAERMGYGLVARLRMVLYDHLLELPARSVTRSSQGAILLRFTGDLSTYRTWISRGFARGIVAACTLAGGLAVLVVIDWVIAMAVATTLLFGAAVSAIWGYQVRRTTRAVRWRRSLLASNVAEQIRSLAVVQAFGRGKGESARLQKQNDDLLGALNRAAGARAVLRFLSSAAGSLAVGAVAIIGLMELDRQRITIGGAVAAMTAARFLAGPVRTMGRSYEYWQAAQVSRRKLEDFLTRTTRTADADADAPLRPRRGRLEFRNVSVAGALRNVDLVVEAGDLIAITGDNGAGKSTLLAAIARAVEPDEGQVVIDDQILAQCSIESTVRNVGIVSPDLPLMRGSIKRNLTYRYRQADDKLVRQAVLDCRVDEVLKAIDGDLSTWLVEGGMNLSIGQRQRIMLARATLGNPRVLLLDEPTANLDAATREVFRRVIARYRGTVLLVTHDPVEASLADQVCVMEAGRITRWISGDEYQAEVRQKRRTQAGKPVW